MWLELILIVGLHCPFLKYLKNVNGVIHHLHFLPMQTVPENKLRSPCGIMAKVLDCDHEVNDVRTPVMLLRLLLN